MFQESELVSVLSTAQALDIKGLSDQSSLKNEVHAASSPKITQPISMVPGFDTNPIPLKKQRTIQTSIKISEEGSSTQAPSSSHNLPELVPVKQEISKVAEDLDQSRSEHFEDKDGVFDSFDGVGQDIVYIDTSIDAGYGDLEHYDEAMGDIDHQDVSLSKWPNSKIVKIISPVSRLAGQWQENLLPWEMLFATIVGRNIVTCLL